jgi:cobalt transporter subunit CbtA
VIRRILLTGIIAGLLSGMVGFALQAVTVTPLILAAEKYEAHSEPTKEAELKDAGSQTLARWSLTLVTSLLIGAGFGLVLAGAIAFSGREPGLKEGLLWGLAGYGVFSLAPALVVAPHLPGMAEGDLMTRQLLWLGAASATGLGLALLAFSRRTAVRGLGIVALAVPILLAGLHPRSVGGSPVPADLAAAFAVATLVASAVFWAILGGAVSRLMRHNFKAPETP